MKKVAYTFFGLLYGFLPMVVALVLGLVFYQSFPNIIGISITVALCISAFVVGRFIFKRVLINGPVDFMSNIHASSDLDNLEPLEYEGTKRRQPKELVSLIKSNDNLFKGGTLCFFGDWLGERYKNNHRIIDASFDELENMLVIFFDNNQSLEIQKPKHIFEASTFLKILKADSLKFTLEHDTLKLDNFDNFFLFYKKEENKISTYSNVSWYTPLFDVSLGEPALMIFSR